MLVVRFIKLTKTLRYALLLFLLALLLAGCAHKANAVNLAKIKIGMTSAQVLEIMGKPAEAQSHGAVGLTSTTYIYRQANTSAKIVLLNDRVMATEGNFK